VITAAYCVHGWLPVSLFMRYGTINYRSGRKATFVEFILHEKYTSSPKEYDIAVLKLENPLVLDEFAKGITLRKIQVPVRTTVTISGFGEPSNGELRYTETNLLVCDNKFVGIICFKNDEYHGACWQDTGGPAIYKNELIGINAFTNRGCNQTHAGEFNEFTSVSFFYDWIMEKTRLNE
jgi:secreted trypsin-like serine protease